MKNEKKAKPSGMSIHRETIRPLSGESMTRARGGLWTMTTTACDSACSHTDYTCTAVGSNHDW